MSTNLVVNGTSYAYPATGDQNWGDQASAWAAAVTSGMLQKSGGSFTLTADANFGTSFGLLSKYFTSSASNPAGTGVLRLSNGDSVSWRNNANSADLGMSVNSSDQLVFNGVVVFSGGAVLTDSTFAVVNASDNTKKIKMSAAGITAGNSRTITMPDADVNLGSLTNSNISSSAAIAYSKLSLSASIVNADISSSAAIAYSKLSLTGSILNADLAGSIAYSKLSLSGAIQNSDLAGSIAASKLIGSDITTVGTIASGTWAGTTVAVNHGGTGVTSVTTAPAASAWAGWDTNSNLSANNHIEGYATTATAAGTTTLTVASAYQQYFTGSTTQTVKLPVTSTLVAGLQFTITNLSSGIVTVQSSGANTLQAMAQNTVLVCTVISTSGTGTASWNWSYQAVQNSLSGGGTVTSVAMTVPSGMTVSGSPVTTSGTLALSGYPNLSVSAVKTTTYSILTTDQLVLLNVSGGAFTSTLPTAVGVTGKTYTIKRVDQTLGTNATIATTSAQTIDGASSFTLGTQYEEITVVSDGANWQVIAHSYPSSWVSYTPTFTALGTVTNNSTFWRRIGDSIEVNSFFTTGTTTAAVAKVSLPSGLSINTSSVLSGVTRCGGGNQVAANTSLIVLSDSSAATVFEFANLANGSNFSAQNGSAAFANSTSTAFQAIVPISGWLG